MIATNRLEEALPLFKKALEVDPDNANTYVQLGRAYHATKNFKETRAALEEVTHRGLHPLTSLVRRSSLEDVFLRLTGRSLIE